MQCHHARQDVPHEEGDRDDGLAPAYLSEHQLYQFPVRVDLWSSEFVHAASRRGIGEDSHTGLSDVVHEYWLQSRTAIPEQRQNRALPRQGGELVQEGIIWAEYHAGTQDRDAVEGFLNKTLSDSPGADIRRIRAGIGA